MFFQNRSPDRFERVPVPNCYKKCSGVPFNIFWVFKKTLFEDHVGPQKLQKSCTPVEGERPFRDPAFHETIVITLPLGTVICLSNFFDGDWLTYCFCCVSLCYVLNNICITCFHKTSINAEPLSPPNFEEIAAH